VTASPVKQFALVRGVPLAQPDRLKSRDFLGWLAGLGPEVGVVAAYGRLLPDEVLALPPRGLLNVHASLLPKFRGAAPVHRAIIAGETETGVTIMRVVRELDSGPMLAAVRRPIGIDETSEDVERALAGLGAALLVETLDDLAAGRSRETPQDDSAATYAPRLTRADGRIDWTRSAREIHDLVRGLHPWPHARTEVGGLRCLILRTAVDGQPPIPAGAAPGMILEARGDALLVLAGAGSIIGVRVLQREGGRPVTAREFLAGHRLRPGMRFGEAPLDP
jgi:methionyl-tRNA formyltransferase